MADLTKGVVMIKDFAEDIAAHSTSYISTVRGRLPSYRERTLEGCLRRLSRRYFR